ncbi:MAG: archaeal proteasome endopeptidase complex subunit alpha [Euryarchaeota archaeon]|nr:archaeal proteasome endopeptidase complex subunit alpha [Euryarchaeota archaeon]
MQPGSAGYDQASTVFSPDGRLYQVEYAREAVRRGTTAVGIRFKDGAVVVAEKRVPSKLIEAESIEKIFKLDHHIGCATSGLVADARAIVDRIRIDSQANRITYDEAATVEHLVKRLSDFLRSFTQYGGARPYGIALLVVGVDETGPRLFETDPSGAVLEYKAAAIGHGRGKATEHIESEYKADMTRDEAIAFALKTVQLATEGALPADQVDVGVVTMDAPFRVLSRDETAEFITASK